jgi:hypothetical protein
MGLMRVNPGVPTFRFGDSVRVFEANEMSHTRPGADRRREKVEAELKVVSVVLASSI